MTTSELSEIEERVDRLISDRTDEGQAEDKMEECQHLRREIYRLQKILELESHTTSALASSSRPGPNTQELQQDIRRLLREVHLNPSLSSAQCVLMLSTAYPTQPMLCLSSSCLRVSICPCLYSFFICHAHFRASICLYVSLSSSIPLSVYLHPSVSSYAFMICIPPSVHVSLFQSIYFAHLCVYLHFVSVVSPYLLFLSLSLSQLIGGFVLVDLRVSVDL